MLRTHITYVFSLRKRNKYIYIYIYQIRSRESEDLAHLQVSIIITAQVNTTLHNHQYYIFTILCNDENHSSEAPINIKGKTDILGKMGRTLSQQKEFTLRL